MVSKHKTRELGSLRRDVYERRLRAKLGIVARPSITFPALTFLSLILRLAIDLVFPSGKSAESWLHSPFQLPSDQKFICISNAPGEPILHHYPHSHPREKERARNIVQSAVLAFSQNLGKELEMDLGWEGLENS